MPRSRSAPGNLPRRTKHRGHRQRSCRFSLRKRVQGIRQRWGQRQLAHQLQTCVAIALQRRFVGQHRQQNVLAALVELAVEQDVNVAQRGWIDAAECRHVADRKAMTHRHTVAAPGCGIAPAVVPKLVTTGQIERYWYQPMIR